MSMGMFTMSDTNPNDVAGGGGCLCAPTKLPHSDGPYAVFQGTEMFDTGSPYAVLCAGCAEQIVGGIHPCKTGADCVCEGTCEPDTTPSTEAVIAAAAKLAKPAPPAKATKPTKSDTKSDRDAF